MAKPKAKWENSEPGKTSVPPAEAGPERLLDIHELGRWLGFHEKTLYAWIGTQGLPCVRIGRALRFRPSEVERWVAARPKEGERDP